MPRLTGGDTTGGLIRLFDLDHDHAKLGVADVPDRSLCRVAILGCRMTASVAS
jgi:hypothetical protein